MLMNIDPDLAVWTRKEDGGWAIYYGPSKFLIAEGSAWSLSVGRRLFELLSTAGL